MREFTENDRPQNKNLVPGRANGATNKINRLKELHKSHGEDADPKQFLLKTMFDPEQEADLRLRAATVLMPYYHGKKPTIIEASVKERKPLVSKETAIRMAQALIATENAA